MATISPVGATDSFTCFQLSIYLDLELDWVQVSTFPRDIARTKIRYQFGIKFLAERSFTINRTTLFNGKTLTDPILTNNEADATEAEKKESVDRREREREREKEREKEREGGGVRGDEKGERDTSWERVRFLALIKIPDK